MHKIFQKSDVVLISRSAIDICRTLEHVKFSGSFPQNCQSICVPYNLRFNDIVAAFLLIIPEKIIVLVILS